MNLTLRRISVTDKGIFSNIFDENNNIFCYGAEHAFPDSDGGFYAKIPAGIYTCVRGLHRLDHMDHDFTTFEVTNVPGHTGILLHVGNFPQTDSDGCILVGSAIMGDMITQSGEAFEKLMNLQDGLNNWQLTVK